MSEREIIHKYLKSLSKYLSRLDKTDADEVLLEIESHIYDAVEMHQEDANSKDVQEILNGFGEPRELAGQYVQHILKGAPPPSGFKAIQSVKKGVTKSLYFSMGLFGFGTATFLIIAGLAKLFIPDSVGVWSVEHGNSVIISFSEHTYPNSEELLGYWLIPITIGLGIGAAYLTKQVLKVLKQNL